MRGGKKFPRLKQVENAVRDGWGGNYPAWPKRQPPPGDSLTGTAGMHTKGVGWRQKEDLGMKPPGRVSPFPALKRCHILVLAGNLTGVLVCKSQNA